MSGPGRVGRPDTRFLAALEALRREIASGRFAAAEIMPGERDLSGLLGVSRTTVRRVLSALADEGLLVQRQGVGTFLRDAAGATMASLTGRVADFDDEVRRRGARGSVREIDRTVSRPSGEEAMMLACPSDAQIVRIELVRYADDRPIGIERSVVPAAMLDQSAVVQASLYAALEACGSKPVRVLQTVRAMILGGCDADRLGISPASPALLILRTVYLADGRCCAFTRATYRTDLYDVVTELQAPAPPGARSVSPGAPPAPNGAKL